MNQSDCPFQPVIPNWGRTDFALFDQQGVDQGCVNAGQVYVHVCGCVVMCVCVCVLDIDETAG